MLNLYKYPQVQLFKQLQHLSRFIIYILKYSNIIVLIIYLLFLFLILYLAVKRYEHITIFVLYLILLFSIVGLVMLHIKSYNNNYYLPVYNSNKIIHRYNKRIHRYKLYDKYSLHLLSYWNNNKLLSHSKHERFCMIPNYGSKYKRIKVFHYSGNIKKSNPKYILIHLDVAPDIYIHHQKVIYLHKNRITVFKYPISSKELNTSINTYNVTVHKNKNIPPYNYLSLYTIPNKYYSILHFHNIYLSKLENRSTIEKLIGDGKSGYNSRIKNMRHERNEYINVLQSGMNKYIDMCNFQIFIALFVILFIISVMFIVLKDFVSDTSGVRHLFNHCVKELMDNYIFHIIPLIIAIIGGILTIHSTGINNILFIDMITFTIPILSSIQFIRCAIKIKYYFDTDK